MKLSEVDKSKLSPMMSHYVELKENYKDVILLYSTDEAWTFLSCFNKTQEHILLELPLATLHLTGEYSAYCVLTAESICVLNETLNLQIPDSGVLLVKLMPINRSL